MLFGLGLYNRGYGLCTSSVVVRWRTRVRDVVCSTTSEAATIPSICISQWFIWFAAVYEWNNAMCSTGGNCDDRSSVSWTGTCRSIEESRHQGSVRVSNCSSNLHNVHYLTFVTATRINEFYYQLACLFLSSHQLITFFFHEITSKCN